MTKSSGIQLNSGLGQQFLGTLRDLQETECPLCSLLSGALKQYTVHPEASVNELGVNELGANEAGVDKLGVDDSTKCFMVWEVDGRRARRRSNELNEDHEKYMNTSRRIRFWWTHKDKKVMEAYILFVAPTDQIEEDTNRQKHQKPEFLAKHFDVQKSKHSVIKGWLSLCEHGHSVCSRSGAAGGGTYDGLDRQRLDYLLNKTSFGVIDVIRMKLCRLPDWQTRYVALSYVWGQGVQSRAHRTQRDNVVKRTSDGGIEERDLPKTIKDAIQLTRDLGLRYIWIDSLCIVQDSISSFRLNAENMDLIYGNAYLTICAADGKDANEGLVALDPDKADTPLRAEYSKGVRLQVTRPSESVIRDSVWDQRAWTFQERILSRRCLVFAGRRVYFQCRSSNMSEDIYRDATGLGLSMDSTNSPLRTLREMQPRPIWFYMTCVSLYTGRHLTYAKDMIPAFEGVSSFMQNRMHGPMARFIYGLPPSHFDLALLWEPLSAQRRRYPSKDAGNEDVELELPSWSWAGWMDVKDVRKGSPVKYKQETLEGCFIDVREWLREHTWISWFIRNSDGDLRPLWHRDYLTEVEGVQPQKRWHGYEVTRRQQPEAEVSTVTGDLRREDSQAAETDLYSIRSQRQGLQEEGRISEARGHDASRNQGGMNIVINNYVDNNSRDPSPEPVHYGSYHPRTKSGDQVEGYDQKVRGRLHVSLNSRFFSCTILTRNSRTRQGMKASALLLFTNMMITPRHQKCRR